MESSVQGLKGQPCPWAQDKDCLQVLLRGEGKNWGDIFKLGAEGQEEVQSHTKPEQGALCRRQSSVVMSRFHLTRMLLLTILLAVMQGSGMHPSKYHLTEVADSRPQGQAHSVLSLGSHLTEQQRHRGSTATPR